MCYDIPTIALLDWIFSGLKINNVSYYCFATVMSPLQLKLIYVLIRLFAIAGSYAILTRSLLSEVGSCTGKPRVPLARPFHSQGGHAFAKPLPHLEFWANFAKNKESPVASAPM